VGPDVILAPVIKSNGYGHGLERAARAFVAGGANWLCVHTYSEGARALALRLDVPVLVVGPLAREEELPALAAGLHLTLTSLARVQRIGALAQENGFVGRVHLKIETGTHRQGIEVDDLPECLRAIAADDALELIGMHSHFANIEDTTRHDFAQRQVDRFEAAVALAEQAGVGPRLRHMASSAATILFPHTHYDLVRPGIAAYGYWPSRETLVSAREKGLDDLELVPALTWKTRVTEVKTVRAGSYIGYGCTDKVEADTRIGVLPVGYADGYRRSMGGHAHVLVRGRRCRVRGRICMNLTMVDLGHLVGVDDGEEVVLLGRQGGEEITAEQVAGWAQTLHYEVLAGLSTSIERRDG
jgi:alanine racemase